MGSEVERWVAATTLAQQTLRSAPMAYELKQLRSTHLSMIEMCLAGSSPADIAGATGYGVEAVRQIIRAPLFQDQLAKRRLQQNKTHDRESAKALTTGKQILLDSVERVCQRQVELSDHPDPRIAQTAISQILDRTFGRGGAEQNSTTIHVSLGARALLTLQTALSEDSEESNGLSTRHGLSSELIEGELVESDSTGVESISPQVSEPVRDTGLDNSDSTSNTDQPALLDLVLEQSRA